jgi:hypothetical protein
MGNLPHTLEVLSRIFIHWSKGLLCGHITHFLYKIWTYYESSVQGVGTFYIFCTRCRHIIHFLYKVWTHYTFCLHIDFFCTRCGHIIHFVYKVWTQIFSLQGVDTLYILLTRCGHRHLFYKVWTHYTFSLQSVDT